MADENASVKPASFGTPKGVQGLGLREELGVKGSWFWRFRVDIQSDRKARMIRFEFKGLGSRISVREGKKIDSPRDHSGWT